MVEALFPFSNCPIQFARLWLLLLFFFFFCLFGDDAACWGLIKMLLAFCLCSSCTSMGSGGEQLHCADTTFFGVKTFGWFCKWQKMSVSDTLECEMVGSVSYHALLHSIGELLCVSIELLVSSLWWVWIQILHSLECLFSRKQI